jgi:hypothetical protein
MHFLDWYTPSREVFRHSNWSTLHRLAQSRSAILVNKCFYGQTPKDHTVLFEKVIWTTTYKKKTDIFSAKTKNCLSENVNNIQGSFFVELDGQ